MTEPTDNGPPLVPGQLDLADLTLEELAAADARFREEMDRLRSRAETYRSERLADVAAKAQSSRTARAELDGAVAAARSAGATWQQIADATGMERQSAWRRWSRSGS